MGVNGNDEKADVKDDQEDALLGMDDEERAWSDISAGDPTVLERRLSRRQRMWSAVASIRSLIDTVLLLVILGLVIERGSQKPASFEVGGDITGFAPKST
jgi:hypothetical protein